MNSSNDSLGPPLSSLRERRLPSGAFPYYPGAEAFSEPTLLALLALLASGAPRAEMEPSVSWLLSAQNGDGSIGVSPEFRRQGTWPTAQLAIVLHHVGAKETLARATDWLLQSRSAVVAQDLNVAQDNSLIGWPWVRGTFGWVEPTAWALIALNLQELAGHPRAVEGRRLLLDRQIPAGGWNYGNREVRGRELLAFVDTTALALLALKDQAATAAVSASLEFLKRSIETLDSPYDLSWALIALEAWGLDGRAERPRLGDALASLPGDELNTTALAMAVIARSGRRVFLP